jgi:hypothetical protein
MTDPAPLPLPPSFSMLLHIFITLNICHNLSAQGVLLPEPHLWQSPGQLKGFCYLNPICGKALDPLGASRQSMIRDKFPTLYCLNFTSRVLSVIRASDYCSEGIWFNSPGRQKFFTSFLPLLNIHIPFSCNNHE